MRFLIFIFKFIVKFFLYNRDVLKSFMIRMEDVILEKLKFVFFSFDNLVCGREVKKLIYCIEK